MSSLYSYFLRQNKDLIQLQCSYLCPEDIKVVSKTCKTLNEIIRTMWQTIYEKWKKVSIHGSFNVQKKYYHGLKADTTCYIIGEERYKNVFCPVIKLKKYTIPINRNNVKHTQIEQNLYILPNFKGTILAISFEGNTSEMELSCYYNNHKVLSVDSKMLIMNNKINTFLPISSNNRKITVNNFKGKIIFDYTEERYPDHIYYMSTRISENIDELTKYIFYIHGSPIRKIEISVAGSNFFNYTKLNEKLWDLYSTNKKPENIAFILLSNTLLPIIYFSHRKISLKINDVLIIKPNFICYRHIVIMRKNRFVDSIF